MTLQEVIARHAATAPGKPSTTYRAGPLLTSERWSDHARFMKHYRATRITRRCQEMADLTAAYLTAFEIIDRVKR